MQVTESLGDTGIYSWESAHYKIADWPAEYEHRQKELIVILKEIGATVFNDQDDGDRQIELSATRSSLQIQEFLIKSKSFTQKFELRLFETTIENKP